MERRIEGLFLCLVGFGMGLIFRSLLRNEKQPGASRQTITLNPTLEENGEEKGREDPPSLIELYKEYLSMQDIMGYDHDSPQMKDLRQKIVREEHQLGHEDHVREAWNMVCD